MRAVERELRLREAVDAAVKVGRWNSTSKEQLLRMLEAALREPQPPSCTCPAPQAGKLNRSCPVHGIAAEEAQEVELDGDISDCLAAEERILRLRGYVAHIHRLAVNDSSMEKAGTLDLLDRLNRPPDAYLRIDEE